MPIGETSRLKCRSRLQSLAFGKILSGGGKQPEASFRQVSFRLCVFSDALRLRVAHLQQGLLQFAGGSDAGDLKRLVDRLHPTSMFLCPLQRIASQKERLSLFPGSPRRHFSGKEALVRALSLRAVRLGRLHP
jgi:hypothetical protein